MVFSFFSCVLFPLNAEEQGVVQICMPESPCVGDKIEVRYIFHTETDVIDGEESRRDMTADLTALPAFIAQSENCTILSATLDRFGADYTLLLTFIGWKVGQIDFAPFALGGCLVNLEPIAIYSVVERAGADGFRPASPPLVVPGTSAVLALLAIFFLVALSGALFALFHIPAIAGFLTKSRAERIARRNMRLALKKLHGLSARGEGLADKAFCAALQHILRNYLSKRFAWDFASVHTAALYETVSGICGGDLTDEQDELVEKLLSLFTRTDYVRYASDSLKKDEREGLIASAKELVEELGGVHADL